jgi:hypothetical protein
MRSPINKIDSYDREVYQKIRGVLLDCRREIVPETGYDRA